MFQSSLAVPLHFTVEFLGFLVTAGGGLLVLARATLIPGGFSNRVSACLGLLTLSAGQVLHGASYLQSDADQTLIAMQALGLALLLVGVVGSLSLRRAAPAALPLNDPLLLGPPAAALLLSLAALGAARTGPKGMRRLSFAALLFAIAGGAIAQAPDAAVGAGELDPYLVGGHIAKLLSFLVLGAWLWTGVRSSIRTRFVASFVALLVVVVLALSTALTGVLTNQVEAAELQRVRTQLTNAVENIRGEQRAEVLRDARAVAGLITVREQMSARSNLGQLAEALVLSDLYTIDFAIFLPRGGGSFYFGRGPSEGFAGRGDPRPPRRNLTRRQMLRLIGSPVVESIAQFNLDETASLDAIQVGRKRFVAILAATTVRRIDQPGRLAGTLVVGTWLDAFEIDRIAESIGTAFPSLVIDDHIRVSALPRPAVEQFRIPPRVLQELQIGRSIAVRQDLQDRSFFSAYTALKSEAGQPIGAAIGLSSPASIVTGTRESLNRILFLVAMAAAGVVLVLAYVSGRRIARPIQSLTDTAGAVREGDLTAQADVSGDDEVGQLGETFNEMTAALLRMTNDLRSAAREEHRLRARIETIIESMADGLIAVDGDMRILAFNPEAEHLTGMGADSAVGRPLAEVVRTSDAQGNPVDLPLYNLAEGSVSGVFLIREDSSKVPVAVTSAVLRAEDGETTGGVAVIRDMSREREVERMKSEFLSNISHELRTPLTPIKGYAEILGRRDVAPEKAKQFVSGILDSTARLERIVELLVDFAALEAGRLAPRISTIDVGQLITKLAEEWKTRAPKHSLEAHVTDRIPKIVGDERLLRRSLEEILDNAVKFSPQGGKIRLTARGATGNGRAGRRSVEVSISDEGIGISPEDLPNIFSDFHQLDGSETRAYGGLGLGLAFVQRIVEAHEGSVAVESQPERGTTLIITIPAARRDTRPRR